MRNVGGSQYLHRIFGPCFGQMNPPFLEVQCNVFKEAEIDAYDLGFGHHR